MDVAEIAVGEFVAALDVRRLLLVDAEMPARIFGHAVLGDEAVLLLRRRLMLAPVVALVKHRLALADQLLRMREGALVEPDSIDLGRHYAAASSSLTPSVCRGAPALP